jgi:lipoyl(octanoyl) transferase
MEIYWLARAEYEPTCRLQEQLRQRVLAGGEEAILLCEHSPVLTLGKYAQRADIFADEQTLSAHRVQVVQTVRGGKVTYHGPGQLLVYPVVRLRSGVHAHMKALAQVATEVAAQLGVCAEFDDERIGVFVGRRKLAALGVHVERQVAIHGMSLNVTAAATMAFRQGWFLPCGERDAQVTSLLEEGATLSPDGQPASPQSASGFEPEFSATDEVAVVVPQVVAALATLWKLRDPSLQRITAPLLSRTLFVK